MSNSDRQIINSDCIVIGAGITGLIIATFLQRKGIKVTVLEKNQNIGGRLSTRHLKHEESIEGVFDDGVQYFSVQNPQFQPWVDDWLEHQLIKEWGEGFRETDSKPCYCGVNGNREIAQYLAQDLNIYNNTEVTKVGYQKQWLIETQNESQYQGHMLVMTDPIPESLAILDASLMPVPLEVRFALEKIAYDRCITLLALLEQPSQIPQPGGIIFDHDCLLWLADNYQKGISPDSYAITLHASPTFSDEYWSSDDAEIAYKLLSTAADYLDSPVIKYQVHRWEYSVPRTFYTESCLTLLEFPLIMAGEAFVAPTVEGAVISAMAAGEFICQRFNIG